MMKAGRSPAHPAAADQPTSAPSFVLVVLATFLGLGFFSFPRDMVMDGVAGAWPAFILTALLGLVGFASTVALSNRLPGHRLVAAYRRATGTLLGSVSATASVVFDVALVAVMLRSAADLIAGMFLFATPILVVVITTAAAAAYTAWPGVHVVSRALPVLLAVELLLGAAIMMLGLKNVQYPWAIFLHAFPLRQGLGDAMNSVYVFFGYSMILNIRPFLPHSHQGRAPVLMWSAFGLTVALLLGMFLMTLGVLSPWGIAHFTWPVASAMRIVKVEGFFIDRFGLLVLAGWSGIAYTFTTVHLLGESLSLADLFGLPPVKAGVFVAPLATMAALGALLPFRDELQMQDVVHHWLDPIGLGLVVLLPALMALVAAMRHISE